MTLVFKHRSVGKSEYVTTLPPNQDYLDAYYEMTNTPPSMRYSLEQLEQSVKGKNEASNKESTTKRLHKN